MGTQALINGKASNPDTYSKLGLVECGNKVSEAPRILHLLSLALERTIQKNERLLKLSLEKDVITIFHGSKAPAMSIQWYVERIFKYSGCSPSCFVVAYIYMDRFLERMNAFLTSLNVHRLLITSIMLAAKFMDDRCYNNAYYAKVGGLSTEELNKLEKKFLFSIDFRLNVSVETFDTYCLQLEEEATAKSHSQSQLQSQIDRSVQYCGLRQGQPNKDESKRAPTISAYP